MCPAERHDLEPPIVPVAADGDVRFGPVPTDVSHQAPDVPGCLRTRWGLAGAQQHCHRPAGDVHMRWRPQLRDPNDDLVLAAAINGRADAHVTYNVRDFSDAAFRFGVRSLRPADMLKE